jgi:hypothetical protein
MRRDTDNASHAIGTRSADCKRSKLGTNACEEILLPNYTTHSQAHLL